MATLFAMPKLGMDMEEGTVIKWFKAEGESVQKGEALAEIETDKSSVEVESPAEGVVLKIYLPEGEEAPCGTPIAAIGAAGEAIPEVGGAAAENTTAAAPTAPAAAATPAVELDKDLFFAMPKLGMDMEEGTVIKWLKAEGESVQKGEALAEIETDKSSVEVESNLSGVVLKIYLPEGEAAPCGTPIAAIGKGGTAVPEKIGAVAAAPAVEEKVSEEKSVQAPAAVAKRPAAAKTAAALTPGGRVRSTPRARKFAEANNIDIAMVPGSGASGRIVEQDVRDFLESGAAFAPTSAPMRVPTETVKPLSGVRKVTARRMHQSLSNTAQTNHKVDVCMKNLMDMRKQLNEHLEKAGKKVSIVDILVKACAKALMDYPQANASLRDDGLHTFNYVNIGIAADTPRGLVVPVLKDADALTLTEISDASKAIIKKARDGALQPDDMSGGTFTISNLGMFEVDSFTAVLNPPETCILAVGRTREVVVVENGQMVIRPMMNLCLTYDHQVIDGADAARLIQTIKHYIENPVLILM